MFYPYARLEPHTLFSKTTPSPQTIITVREVILEPTWLFCLVGHVQSDQLYSSSPFVLDSEDQLSHIQSRAISRANSAIDGTFLGASLVQTLLFALRIDINRYHILRLYAASVSASRRSWNYFFNMSTELSVICAI